jgi:ubiquinone/menaquinone biosynthesis C-methylase UbiE
METPHPQKKSSSNKPTSKKVHFGKMAHLNRIEQATSNALTTHLAKKMHKSSRGAKTTDQAPQALHTSWGGVADWYDNHLEKNDDTYHAKVIFPNLLRLLSDVTGKKILDLACGQGVFSRELRARGAFVTGVDIGKELIAIAESKNESIKDKGTHKIVYHAASADDLYMIKDASIDHVVCVLALQNIENLTKSISEASRILTKNGSFVFVLNHPSFRNPRKSGWGYSDSEQVQYRRIDAYMSESHIKIDMTPGSEKSKKWTVSFHRPLQMYVKTLSKHGFAVTKLEEWVSHKESEKGPRKHAEDVSRKEIPLFMCIEAKKLG